MSIYELYRKCITEHNLRSTDKIDDESLIDSYLWDYRKSHLKDLEIAKLNFLTDLNLTFNLTFNC